MSADLSLTLEDFKREAAVLIRSLPTVQDADRIEAGIKCLNLAYLSIAYPDPVAEKWQRAIAVSVWDYASRKALARQIDLLLIS